MKIKSHATAVPLIGNFTLAAEQVTGIKSSYLVSNANAFLGNEQHYLDYKEQLGEKQEYIDVKESGFNSNIRSWPKCENVDLVVGVPPCSSLSGSNRQAGFMTGTGCHMYKFTEYVTKVIRPKLWVFENAPTFASLTSDRGIQTRKALQALVKEPEYQLFTIKTNTANFSIPQVRPRSYAIFVRNDQVANLPKQLLEANQRVYKLGSINKELNVRDFLAKVNSPGEPDPVFTKIVNDFKELLGIDLYSHAKLRNASIGSILKHAKYEFTIGKLYEYIEGMWEEYEAAGEKVPSLVKGLSTELTSIYDNLKRGFGYYSPMILGTKYTNTLFQQSLPMIFTEQGARLSQPEVAALMGMPAWFGTADLGNQSDYFRKLTQACPVATNEKVLEFLIG